MQGIVSRKQTEVDTFQIERAKAVKEATDSFTAFALSIWKATLMDNR
jgi:hypothetical protein